MSKPRMGAPKRVAVGLLAGSLAMFGVALAPSAGATTAVTSARLAGTTRYGTAKAISADASLGTPAYAIVATGENYPDALAASSLAGANAPAPIILTQATTYTDDAKTALAALKAKGVTAVTLVGGTTAVAQSVEDAIKADGFTVTRVAGTDRYDTAAKIATAANTKSPAAPVGGFKTALIATGANFPDALAGGPAAYRNKLPLLLVGTTIPKATSDAITALGIKKAVILGGTDAVSDAIKTQLDTLTGNPSTRLAGTNRFGTAAAVGNYEITSLLFGASSAVLATGTNFPDALAAGPLGGANQAPIVLTASLPADSQAFLDAHSNTITKLFVSGGTAAIDDATVTAAQTAAQTVSNDTGGTSGTSATDAPELLSAALSSQLTASSTVKFTFDEPVNGKVPDFTKFHLYTNAGNTVSNTPTSRFDGTAAQVSTTDNNSVLVSFPTTAAQFSSITLATVETTAVTDATAKNNPEGDVAIGSFSASAGTTSAPDLLSVGNYRADATGTGMLVDLTFDANAIVNGATSTNALGTPNTYGQVHFVYNSSSNDYALADDVSGQGTKVLTFHISDQAGGAFDANSITISNLALARVYVTQGGITDGTNAAPLESVDAGYSGATNSPDLVSATFNANATTTGGASIDQVTYKFDEPVNTVVIGRFHVYNVDASFGTDNGTAIVSPTDNTSVIANFADGSLATSVGAYVDSGAVKGTTGSALTNVADEEAVSGVTFQAGKTAGPDLIAAAISASTTDPFSGAVTGYQVTYTFDEAIASATVGNFKVYAGTTPTAGAAVSSAGCAAAVSTTNTAQVVVTGCTALTPNNAILMGGFKLATVARDAVAAADGGAKNPEGAEPITGP